MRLFGKLKLTNCARPGNRAGLFRARFSEIEADLPWLPHPPHRSTLTLSNQRPPDGGLFHFQHPVLSCRLIRQTTMRGGPIRGRRERVPAAASPIPTIGQTHSSICVRLRPARSRALPHLSRPRSSAQWPGIRRSRRALIASGLSPEQASDLVGRAAARRAEKGLRESDPVPDIPIAIWRRRRN
jgi:hypothetical protein